MKKETAEAALSHIRDMLGKPDKMGAAFIDGDFTVTNWDDSTEVVEARGMTDGYVMLTYPDGTCHSVTPKAFSDLRPVRA